MSAPSALRAPLGLSAAVHVAVALALPAVLARWPAPGGSPAHPAPIEVAIIVQAPPPGAGPITPPGLKSPLASLASPVPEAPSVPVSVPAEDEPTASPPIAGTGDRSALQGLSAAQGGGEAPGAATALSPGGQATGAGAHVEAASGARSGGGPDAGGSDGRPGASFGVVGNGLFVRPLGGYQVRPHYPESARRQRIEGTTLLRARVTERGRVETVEVERSAGHRDLDRSAADAVRRWRFEPARRGKEPVAVWVLIPVKFELR